MSRRPTPIAVAKLVAGIGIAGFFSYRAFGKLDWKVTGTALRDANPVWILLAVMALGFDYSIRVLRWWLMLRQINPELPLSASFRPFLGSTALNNVLPFRAGDFARAAAFGKDLGIDTGAVLGTMVIERLLDLLSIVAVFAVSLSGARPEGIPPSLAAGAGVVAGLSGLLLAVLLVTPQRAARLIERVGKSPGSKRISGAIVRFLDSLAILRSPSRAASLVGLSFAAWLFEGATFAAVAQALHQNQGASGGWFAMSVGTLSTMIPSTPGAIGVFDYFTSLAFQGYGMAKDPSTLAALVVHVVLWLPLTVAGLALLGIRAHPKTPIETLDLAAETAR